MESFVEASAVLRSTQSSWTFVVLNFVIWQRCSLANVITFWMICSLSAGTGRPQVLLKSGRELDIYLSWPKAKPLIPLSILHCNSLLRLNSYWYIQDFKLKRFLWTEPLSLTPYGIRIRVCWKISPWLFQLVWFCPQIMWRWRRLIIAVHFLKYLAF